MLKLETLAPNFTRLTLANGIVIWFSYETPIAYADAVGNAIVSENIWGPTTGKHLKQVVAERGQSGSSVDGALFPGYVNSYTR